MQQLLRLDNGICVFRVSGDLQLCVHDDRFTYFNIRDLEKAANQRVGTTPQEYKSLILLALGAGLM